MIRYVLSMLGRLIIQGVLLGNITKSYKHIEVIAFNIIPIDIRVEVLIGLLSFVKLERVNRLCFIYSLS